MTKTNVPITVHITEVATGETVKHHCTTELNENGPFIYLWTDGNYGCDCNRELFFNRCKGVELDLMSTECGTSRYQIKMILDSDGSVIYDDKEGDNA